MKRLFAISVATWWGLAATSFAADLPTKAPVAAPSCTISQCSGWYAGVALAGVMTNVDVIGQGVNNSILAGGAIGDLHAGYQIWNGTFFAAIEGAVGMKSAPQGSDQNGEAFGMVLGKFGLAFAGILGNPTAPSTPTQSPFSITLPAGLQLLSPYIAVGQKWQGKQQQQVTGVGTEFLLMAGYNLSLEYLYGPPSKQGVQPDQIARLSVNKKF